MNQAIDIQAWRKDGEQLWAQIQERKLVVIWWNNPWFRFAVIGLVLLIAAAVTWLIWRDNLISGLFVLLALPCAYIATKYYAIQARTGGLYSFFSDTGFGIGCDADRLSFPYSSLQLPGMVSPSTVNENYIVLPVKPEIQGVKIERKSGADSTWDGTPYKRGIASIFIKDGAVHVRANPNEMIVHLFCAIYPLAMYLDAKAKASNTAAETSPPPSS